MLNLCVCERHVFEVVSNMLIIEFRGSLANLV